MENHIIKLAEDKWNQQDYPAAADMLDSYLFKHPNDLTAINLRALVDHSMGNSEHAVTRLSKALGQAPNALLLQYNLGVILNDLARYEEAEKILVPLVESHPNPVTVLRQLERTYARLKNFGALLDVYIWLMELNAFEDSCRPNLHHCMEYCSPLNYKPAFEPEIIRYLTDDEKDPEAIRKLASIQLSAKYQLKSSDSNVTAKEFADDPFFLCVLTTLQVSDPGIEGLLIALRRELLADVVNTGQLDDLLVPVAVALAIQNYFNEYVHAIDVDEQNVINQLISGVSENLSVDDFDVDTVTYTLLIIAMYSNPCDIPNIGKMLGSDSPQWPTPLTPIRDLLLDEKERELLASEVIAQSSIEDTVSQKVQRQYEENPYPRWLRCCPMAYRSLAERLEAVLFDFSATEPLHNSRLNLLIAGCGTGKQVVQYARSFPEARIVAFDLSSKSLAYTQQKLNQYNLTNVELFQADILSVEQFENDFDVIVCTGVLHHIKEPVTAWMRLLSMLRDGGYMHIALYSRLARGHINNIRDVIEREQLTPDVHSIRDVRTRVMTGELNDLTNSSDFYSASNCRDLLFHIQEKQYDLPEIKDILAELQLDFLGFDKEVKRLPGFQEFFPDQSMSLDLDCWHRYEQEYPDTFAAMYSFWCAKPGA